MGFIYFMCVYFIFSRLYLSAILLLLLFFASARASHILERIGNATEMPIFSGRLLDIQMLYNLFIVCYVVRRVQCLVVVFLLLNCRSCRRDYENQRIISYFIESTVNIKREKMKWESWRTTQFRRSRRMGVAQCRWILLHTITAHYKFGFNATAKKEISIDRWMEFEFLCVC